MPPKKDAFADLFLSATKSLQSPSLNASLNNLSLQNSQQKPQNTSLWSNLDILSPTNVSPQTSQSATPKPLETNQVIDPFLIFDLKPANLASSSSNSSLTANLQPATNTRPNPGATPQNNSVLLLDDEFTDAFEPEQKLEKRKDNFSGFHQDIPNPIAPVPERPAAPRNSGLFSLQRARNSASTTDERDTVLASLVDIGFPIEVANQAIDLVGPDVQKCVNFIMSGGRESESPTTSKKQGRKSNSPDAGPSFQEVSTDLLKKASWFINKSKNTVIKNINQLQNGQARDTNQVPAWMRNQDKYKAQNNEEGEVDLEEVQRIMKLQKQREKERQKERMDSLRKQPSSSGREEPIRARPQRELPPPVPKLPTRPMSTPGPAKPARPVRSGSSMPTQPPVSRSDRSTPVEVDLLGLGQPLLRAEKFKQSSGDAETYILPLRRKAVAKNRIATAEPLNAFQQSDFETFKQRATESFTQGDYGEALDNYTKCIESLPAKHELRIVILSNLAITQIKLGNYKSARQSCDLGMELVGENLDDSDWTISDKVIKYWYIKLLTRKAESLEMLENFPESLDCYVELITKHGVNDKKTMDAKRRIANIVNPPKPRAKPQPKAQTPATFANEKVERIKEQHKQEKLQDEMKFRLHDQVHEKISLWAAGNEDNLRNLLMSLHEVIPSNLGFPFLQKQITISDLMLTKKVKINYMKVISAIHPDKLGKFQLEDQMICQAVFVALNKAWDAFKEQNGIN